MTDSKALDALKRLKELQVKCLPDYDANEKELHFKWYLDTPDAIELARTIIDLDEQTTDALTELAEIKKRLIDKSLELQKGLGELDDPRMSKETKSFYRAIAMAKIGVIDYIIKGEGK